MLVVALVASCLSPTFCYSQGDPPISPDEARQFPTVGQRDGEKRSVVKAVQYLLRARGHNLVVDGVFGNQTAWHVKDFQRKHHLRPTGAVDDATWEQLVITVQQGSRGDAVRAAQSRLRSHGHYVAVDGVFGGQTQQAVGLFQSARGNLVVDGVVGPRTWCFLVNGLVAP